MTALEILEHHNKWRRGETDDPRYSPREIGLAIDYAILFMKMYGEIVGKESD